MFFRYGEQLQKDLTDATFGLLAGDPNTPRRTLKTALDAAQLAAYAAGSIAPEGFGRTAFTEFQNKLEAFNLFAHVDLVLELPSGRNLSLQELVERASSLGPFRSVWAMEGAGHFYAETRTASGRPVILRNEDEALPTHSLTALHAGAGLSFAERALAELKERSSDGDIANALHSFVKICDESSHPSYAGATYEALGLVARNLHPHLIERIDSQLSRADEAMRGYFWHGTGRGLYFAPTNFIPIGASRRAVSQAMKEPPHELGRLNALSGLAWALTLVNIRHAATLESFLSENASGNQEAEAFANGISSALIVWRDCAPDDYAPEALCTHSPNDPRTRTLWEKCVSSPCAEGLDLYHALLREAGGIGRLFRYQPLDELAAELDAELKKRRAGEF